MSFCMAGVAFRDILTRLKKCRKTFCVTGTILLQGFQKMACIFRVHLHPAWQAQHFRRVALRVFRESQCQGCMTWTTFLNCLASVEHA